MTTFNFNLMTVRYKYVTKDVKSKSHFFFKTQSCRFHLISKKKGIIMDTVKREQNMCKATDMKMDSEWMNPSIRETRNAYASFREGRNVRSLSRFFSLTHCWISFRDWHGIEKTNYNDRRSRISKILGNMRATRGLASSRFQPSYSR